MLKLPVLKLTAFVISILFSSPGSAWWLWEWKPISYTLEADCITVALHLVDCVCFWQRHVMALTVSLFFVNPYPCDETSMSPPRIEPPGTSINCCGPWKMGRVSIGSSSNELQVKTLRISYNWIFCVSYISLACLVHSSYMKSAKICTYLYLLSSFIFDNQTSYGQHTEHASVSLLNAPPQPWQADIPFFQNFWIIEWHISQV